HAGRVGVFVGATSTANGEFSNNLIANLTSQFFNLRGPSIIANTASASSMTALHIACQALLQGECDVAVAGGVATLHPEHYVSLGRMQLLSSGHNKGVFGDSDGFILSEAVGAVLLKPLSRAIQDGDSIFSVIRSTATNSTSDENPYNIRDAQAQLVQDNLA